MKIKFNEDINLKKSLTEIKLETTDLVSEIEKIINENPTNRMNQQKKDYRELKTKWETLITQIKC